MLGVADGLKSFGFRGYGEGVIGVSGGRLAVWAGAEGEG